MTDQTIEAVDGRTISFADYGKPEDIAVLCCHGGPGSRREQKASAEAAIAAGFRLIGIDRPGYGASTVQPGRSIGGWTADALAVADSLEVDRFLMMGNSTGGAYALATASVAPGRVLGVLVGCGMSDVSWASKVDEAAMPVAMTIWNAPDRDAAIAIANQDFGAHGEKMMAPADPASMFSPPDLAALAAAETMAPDPDNLPFAQGVVGYVDDRIADGPANGWSSFDVTRVSCPVIMIHGEQDLIVPIAHARHTRDLLKDAELRTYPEHGHLSVGAESLNALMDLRKKANS